MSEDEAKKKRKKRLPPTWSNGRLLGQLSRRNPELYQTINEYAKATGRRPTEILEEAFDYYFVKRRISQRELTVDQLYDAWMILREMLATASEIWASTASIVTSDQYRFLLDLGREVSPPTEFTPVTVKAPRKLAQIREKLLDRFEPLLDYAIEWSIQALFKAFQPYGAKMPKALKRKIPVTITYKSNED